MAEGRILGIDYGRRRVGLALSDPLGLTAQPLARVDVKSLAEAIERVAAVSLEHGVTAVVVGLPCNMDGSEGPMATEARQFADGLRRRLDLPVRLWDERLTSREATRALGRSGASRAQRKRRVDVMAAQLLLQSFLDQPDGPPSPDLEEPEAC